MEYNIKKKFKLCPRIFLWPPVKKRLVTTGLGLSIYNIIHNNKSRYLSRNCSHLSSINNIKNYVDNYNIYRYIGVLINMSIVGKQFYNF